MSLHTTMIFNTLGHRCETKVLAALSGSSRVYPNQMLRLAQDAPSMALEMEQNIWLGITIDDKHLRPDARGLL